MLYWGVVSHTFPGMCLFPLWKWMVLLLICIINDEKLKCYWLTEKTLSSHSNKATVVNQLTFIHSITIKLIIAMRVLWPCWAHHRQLVWCASSFDNLLIYEKNNTQNKFIIMLSLALLCHNRCTSLKTSLEEGLEAQHTGIDRGTVPAADRIEVWAGTPAGLIGTLALEGGPVLE